MVMSSFLSPHRSGFNGQEVGTRIVITDDDKDPGATADRKGGMGEVYRAAVRLCEGKPLPPKAIVQFDSGITLMVDERMKWERLT